MVNLKVENESTKDVTLSLESLPSGLVALRANNVVLLWVTYCGSIQRNNTAEDKVLLRKMGFTIDDEYGAGGVKFY